MIARQHIFLCQWKNAPCKWFYALPCFIYHQGVEIELGNFCIVQANRGACNYLRFGIQFFFVISLEFFYCCSYIFYFFKQKVALFSFCFTKMLFILKCHFSEFFGPYF